MIVAEDDESTSRSLTESFNELGDAGYRLIQFAEPFYIFEREDYSQVLFEMDGEDESGS